MYLKKHSVNYKEECLRLREHLVSMLDITGQLHSLDMEVAQQEQLLSACHKPGEIAPPLTVIVRMNFQQALEVSDELADALLNEPDSVRDAAQDVIGCAVRVLGDFTRRHVEMRVEMRAWAAPALTGAALAGFCLGTADAVVVGRSSGDSYLRSTVVRCCSTDCAGSAGQRVSCAAGSTCSHCTGPVFEVAAARSTGQLVTAHLAPITALRTGLGSYQCILATFKDELALDLTLGERYDITGRHTVFGFEAWGVAAYKPPLPPVPRPFAKLAAQLCLQAGQSPFRLPIALATRLAQHLLPPQSHRELRLCLLLSLASLKCGRPVPLLIVGPDSQSAQLVSREAARAAERCVCTPWGVAPWGVATCDGRGVGWTEAGALALASGGVCLVDDWVATREQHRRVILTALESGVVTMPSSTRAAALPAEPLRCAVWAVHTQDIDTPAALKHLRSLINVFGMPFISEDGSHEDEVAQSILQSAMGVKTPRFPDHVLRQFLAHAAALEVTLNGAATRLIRNYFVASRRLRPACLPVNAIATITSLSEAHARLSLRGVAGTQDVVAVLSLYERSVARLFGTASACPPPPPPTDPVDVDREMAEFNAWLRSVLKAVLGDDCETRLPEE